MRVGYCRVSTKTAEQTASIESQAERLRRAGCHRVLIDHGISGFREDGRAGSCFPELIELILSGVATEVVVGHFDRTQRRVKWGMVLLDALEQAKVRLLELDTGTWLDPAHNPTDVLMAQIRSAIQENESRVKRLKIRRALKDKRDNGKYASGHVPFGYAVLDGQIVRHPENWERAQERWRVLEEIGFSWSGYLARTGDDISAQGVRAWALNPILRGEVPHQPSLTAPVLVSARQWEAARRAMAIRSRSRGVTQANRVHLFTGLVMCDACGKNMHTLIEFSPQGVMRKRLKCMRRQCERHGRGIREDIVKRQCIEALLAKHQELAALAMQPGAADHSAGLTEEEDEEQRQLQADVDRLRELSHLPGIDALLAPLEQRLRLKQREVAMEEPLQLEVLDQLFRDPATLAAATDEELRAVVIEFIAQITWPGERERVLLKMR